LSSTFYYLIRPLHISFHRYHNSFPWFCRQRAGIHLTRNTFLAALLPEGREFLYISLVSKVFQLRDHFGRWRLTTVSFRRVPQNKITVTIGLKVLSMCNMYNLLIMFLMCSNGRSEDRIPMGARFSSPVLTGPGVHPASHTVDTASFPGVKRSGRGVNHQPHLAPRLKKEYGYTSSPHLGLRGLFLGEICLYLMCSTTCCH